MIPPIAPKPKFRLTAHKVTGEPPTVMEFDTVKEADDFYFELKRRHKYLTYVGVKIEKIEP